MLKKTITYKDYNDNERTEDFYFNLTQSEVTELELSTKGGLVETINTIVAAQDGEKIIKLFKDLLFRSYGEKSPDGRRFIKSQELSEAFSQTEAYDKLFISIVTDPDNASAFFNGILPNKPE